MRPKDIFLTVLGLVHMFLGKLRQAKKFFLESTGFFLHSCHML